MEKSIVLTGGGTAGHVIPNIALLGELSKKFEKIYYIGSDGMEKNLLKNYPYVKFFSISCVKFRRGIYLNNLVIPFKLLKSIKEAYKILKNIQPDVIFSKGGYVALPVVIAGSKLKIPCITHESDITPGLANKIMSSYCKKVFTAFDATAKRFKNKAVCTGNPIRNLDCDKNEALKYSAFSKNLPIILFFGGSLGAKSINEFISSNYIELTKKFNIIHITGKNNKTDIINPNYRQTEFCNDMKIAYAAADVVVCRAGANTIFELMYLKKPSILIPLETGRGDQLKNAEYCKNNNIASVIKQENLTLEKIMFEIDYLLKNKEEIENNIAAFMPESPNAYICEKITEIIK